MLTWTGVGFRKLAGATRMLHWELLRPSHIKFSVTNLPVTQKPDAGRIEVPVHATPRDPMDEYLAADKEGC